MRRLFEAFMSEYIQFAAQNPEIYRLMCGSELWKTNPSARLNQTARAAFRMYAETLEQLHNAGRIKVENPLRTAQVTWATLHGLASLLNDGVLVRREDLEEITKYGLSALFNSLNITNE